MHFYKHARIGAGLLLLCAVSSCVDWSFDQTKFGLPKAGGKKSENTARFEGGNLGAVVRTEARTELHLRSDNDDDGLPKYWRQWWYTALDVTPGATSDLVLRGRGQWNYYLPVYSYDNETWHQFSESQVTQEVLHELRIRAAFKKSPVYLARYVPYTYTTMMSYLSQISANSDVRVENAGFSPLGRPIPLIKTGYASERSKRRHCKLHLLAHARTHPGEVGSSFLLEGLLDEYFDPEFLPHRRRLGLCLTVLPMVNVDGVVIGNNRTNAASINLEGKWLFSKRNPLRSLRSMPREVKIQHDVFRKTYKERGQILAALNLHASNSAPEAQTFFFPHFGAAKAGYKRDEVALRTKQIKLIERFRRLVGPESVLSYPEDGGRDFVERDMPESFWWKLAKAKVLALSVEATYGYAGKSERWKSPDDLRLAGAALLYAAAGIDSRSVVRKLKQRGEALKVAAWPYKTRFPLQKHHELAHEPISKSAGR